MSRFLLSLWLFFTTLPAQAIGRETCDNLLVVRRNLFCVSRGMQEYNRILAYELETVLRRIERQGGGHWLDLGAGEGCAQMEYLQRRTARNVYGTSIAVRIPFPCHEKIRAMTRRLAPRFRFIENWFTDELAHQLSPVDLITDVYGVLNYTLTEHRQELLNIYIEMLKPGGVLLFVTDDEWPEREVLDADPRVGIWRRQIPYDRNTPFFYVRKKAL